MSREMLLVKEYLYDRYGCRCEVCKKSFSRSELTGHHIIMKCFGGIASKTNILIACYHCHFVIINHIPYDTKEYWDLMHKSLEHRNPEDIGSFPYS